MIPPPKTNSPGIEQPTTSPTSEAVKEFSNWEEKNSYIAQKMTDEKSTDILEITNKLANDRGDFSDFLKSENVNCLVKIIKEVTAGGKVKNGYEPTYGILSGDRVSPDSDYGFVLEKVLPAVFQKNIEAGEHKSNLSILQAWAQTEEFLMGEQDRASNAANVKEAFTESLNDARISVLEKLYINYLGQKFNQSDADDLKMWLPKIYKKFKDEQLEIEHSRKELPDNFQLDLSVLARRALLLDKYGFSPISSPENDWRENNCEERLLTLREHQKKIKPGETEIFKGKKDYSGEVNWSHFRNSEAGRLLPCRKKINPMELDKTDGEYIVADFSLDYDGIYSVAGNLEAFAKKSDLDNAIVGQPIEACDFLEIKNEINFSRNQDIVAFKVMSSLFFRAELEKKCGVDISQLNLKTQYQFLNFISEYPECKFMELRKFMDNGVSADKKNDRLKSFLCLELDDKLGTEIIDLGEKLPPQQADLFFSKVAMINDLAAKEESDLGSILVKDNQSLDFFALRSTLLKNACDLIVKFSAVTKEKFSAEETRDLFQELEGVKKEMILLASILKTAKQQGEPIDFEKIKGLKLERRILGEIKKDTLSEEEKNELKDIVAKNYQEIFLQPGKNFNPEAYQRVTKEFAVELESPETQLAYILKYKDQIVSFARYKALSEHEVYGGSLNVSRDLKGLSIGKYFTQAAEGEISQQYDIRIKSRFENPANEMYQKNGFVIVGEHTEKDGVKYYDMVKPSRIAEKRMVA